MAIPDFQSLMLPLLKLAADNNEHATREATVRLAQEFLLSDDEKEILLPSGQQTVLGNRVSWAVSHLKHAGLLESTRKGFFRITHRGVQTLQQNPSRIDIKFLKQFAEYREFITPEKDKIPGVALPDGNIETITSQTPEELLEGSYQSIRQELAQELLSQVKKASPIFFEALVVDLLVKMGYGGSRKDAGERVGKSGDGGIDGIIKEDRLGLDAIYIQAKRWDAVVGGPEIRGFAGALMGQKAKKGIFITTSRFSDKAYSYVESIDSKIVLIDGKQLAQYMIDFNVGVSRVSTYEIKKIDTDYFNDV
jgi:restriction system protein